MKTVEDIQKMEQKESEIGQKLIEILKLKVYDSNKVHTAYGAKTPLDLYRMVKQFMHDIDEQA